MRNRCRFIHANCNKSRVVQRIQMKFPINEISTRNFIRDGGLIVRRARIIIFHPREPFVGIPELWYQKGIPRVIQFILTKKINIL